MTLVPHEVPCAWHRVYTVIWLIALQHYDGWVLPSDLLALVVWLVKRVMSGRLVIINVTSGTRLVAELVYAVNLSRHHHQAMDVTQLKVLCLFQVP